MEGSLAYLITVSQQHLLPAQMLLHTLCPKTKSPIVAVGNLDDTGRRLIQAHGVTYIDENDIDLSGRLPMVTWKEKHREFGWYKQQFIRLAVDRFMDAEDVVILDSEVFVFDNWDASRLREAGGRPRCLYWIPSQRKPDWDYQMYRGSARLLAPLPECQEVLAYANSDSFPRFISGVAVFSPSNIAELWRRLQRDTDVEQSLDVILNREPDLAFSEFVVYGLAAKYGIFDSTRPAVMHPGLLGWYDNHDDPVFHKFKRDAMWSMCQGYSRYPDAPAYWSFMKGTAAALGRELRQPPYWNPKDADLVGRKSQDARGLQYFSAYRKQLDHSFRRRYNTMRRALSLLTEVRNPTIVEIGTLRDDTRGGGHSTYKFGEFCARFGGTLHTVDISSEAITFAMRGAVAYQPWIKFHTRDSEEFLRDFPDKIDFLYLDGYDSLPGEEKAASAKQLREIEAALPHLADRCVVLLDDADLPEGGKAALSSRFLREHGFTLEADAYQRLFARGFSRRPVHSESVPERLREWLRQVREAPVP